MSNTKNMDAGYKSDRRIFEDEVLRLYNAERKAGNKATLSYGTAAARFNQAHGRNIGWWQVYYVVAKARKEGKEVR